MIERVLAAIRQKISNLLVRVVLTAIDDSLTDRQGLTSPQRIKGQAFAGEKELEDVAHLQPYGLHAVPLAGAEGVGLAIGGSRSHLVVLAVDDPRHSPSGMAPGEVALYSDVRRWIYCKADNTLVVSGGTYEGSHTTIDLGAIDVEVTAFDSIEIIAIVGAINIIQSGSADIFLGAIAGDVNISAGGDVTISASGTINLTGDVVVTGDLEYTGSLKQTAANVDLTAHVHATHDTEGPEDP